MFQTTDSRFKKSPSEIGCSLANVFGKGFGHQSNDHEMNASVSHQGIIWGTHQGTTYSAKKLVLKVKPRMQTPPLPNAYLSDLRSATTNGSDTPYGTTYS